MQIRVTPAEKNDAFYVEFRSDADNTEWVRLTAPWEDGAEQRPGVTFRPPRGRWIPWEDHPGGWKEIRAVFDRELTVYEVLKVAGALGYALREHVVGEELSLPRVAIPVEDGTTVLEFEYDSAKSRRSERHDADAFDAASQYVIEGTPVRKTDRRGPGTQGTRLVNGIGPIKVEFLVR
jgi:hypothetical protein